MLADVVALSPKAPLDRAVLPNVAFVAAAATIPPRAYARSRKHSPAVILALRRIRSAIATSS